VIVSNMQWHHEPFFIPWPRFVRSRSNRMLRNDHLAYGTASVRIR